MFWFHLLFAVLIWGIAAALTFPAFAPTLGYPYWPILLGGIGALAAVSSLAPLELRVQAFTGASIFGAAVFRMLMYVQALMEDRLVVATPIIVSLILHWGIVAALGAAWPAISMQAGTRWTVEAGRPDVAR
jgi:hypothetical protein